MSVRTNEGHVCSTPSATTSPGMAGEATGARRASKGCKTGRTWQLIQQAACARGSWATLSQFIGEARAMCRRASASLG